MSSFPGETPRPLPANGVRSGMSSRGYRNWQDQGKSRGCLARLRSPCIPGARAHEVTWSLGCHTWKTGALCIQEAQGPFSPGPCVQLQEFTVYRLARSEHVCKRHTLLAAQTNRVS